MKDNVNISSNPLIFIINRSFEQVIFPESLKIAYFTPVHKNEDAATINNYALYLYCRFSIKYLKKLYIIEFTLFSVKHKLTNSNQFGFWSKSSKEHALISLIETIEKYLDESEVLCELFIDFQKIFDTVNRELLLE